MGYRLVRIDSDNPTEIILSMGTHAFGRGVLFDCDDRKVSRQHGELLASKDSITLTALAENPCFLKRNGLQQIEILTRKKSTQLYNGDQIGLIPNEYWYKLIFCGVPELPTQAGSQPNYETLPSVAGCNDEPCDTKEGIVDQANPDQVMSPQKRPHVPDEDCDLKRVKTEPPDVKMEPANDAQNVVKTEPPDQPMPSCSSGPSPPAPLRERCWYGTTCYRKNPVHKADFSHPSDADWGSGPRAPCPYGTGCAKRDPRHWRDHDHPPGTPAPNSQYRAYQPRPDLVFVYAEHFDDDFYSANSDDGSVDCDYDFF